MDIRRFSLTPPPLPPPNALPAKKITNLQLNHTKNYQSKYTKVMDPEHPSSEVANHAIIFRVFIILVILFILVAIVFGVLLVRLITSSTEQQQYTVLVEESRGNGSCKCNSSYSDPTTLNFMDTVYNLKQKMLLQMTTTTTEKPELIFEEEEMLKKELRHLKNAPRIIKISRQKKPIEDFDPEGGESTTYVTATTEFSTTTYFSPSSSPSSPPPSPSTQNITPITTPTESQTFTFTNFEDDENSTSFFNSSRKLTFIRNMLRKEWVNYRTHAWGEDSMTPISLKPVEKVFGLQTGSYLVAGLSSLWVMGLEEEFREAVAWTNITDLKANFATSRHLEGVHVYLTVANYLGGLLSAFVLSGEAVLLERASQLAELLDGAYNKKTGLPRRFYNPNHWLRRPNQNESYPIFLPHITATQLEYSSLYQLTGNSNYQGRIEAVTRLLSTLKRPYAGLYLDYVNPDNGQWASKAEILGGSRPLYAHLIKRYIQSGRTDHRSFKLFKLALWALERNRVFIVDPPTGQMLVNCLEDYEDVAVDVMLFEGCQLGATLGLGARELEKEFELTKENLTSAQQRKAQYRIYRLWELAEKITETCYRQSIRSTSGLPPSRFYFTEGGGVSAEEMANITRPKDFKFTLSPELAESYFTLWRLTHERKYRDYAWQAVQAIAANARHPSTGSAATVAAVGPDALLPTVLEDEQPVHYIAGTLKFLYLTFAEDDLLPLDSYVFTSFGQPLPIEVRKEGLGRGVDEKRR